MIYKILLADDDYYFRKIVQKHYTQKSQYNIIAVSGGEEALSVLKNNKFDAAIIDFHLPQKSADQILAIMHTTGIAIPVIVVTGDESIETERLVRSHGADYFFVKPVELSDIDLVLNELIIKNRTIYYQK